MTTVIYVESVEQVPTSSTLVFTCAADATYATIEHVLCHNASSAAASITFNIVSSGGSVADTNIYKGPVKVLAKKEDGIYDLVGAKLYPGDSVYVIGSAASALNLKMSFKEITE